MQNARKKLAAALVVAGVTLSAGGVLTPLADAQDDRTERTERREQRMQDRAERMQSRQERLQTMVDAGTITQERADEIRARQADRAASRAGHREERRAARSERREALAATLGTTVDELKAELRAGTSLAEIAQAAGVDLDVIIDQLVEASEARLSDAVSAGRIDQATADARLDAIRDRITKRLNG